MGSTKLRYLATASLLLAGTASNAAQPGDAAAAIDIHVSAGYSPALVKTLADLGEPTPITLRANETARAAIEARCGTVDPVYLVAFLNENRDRHPNLTLDDLENAGGERHFRFPYCLPRQTVRAPLNVKTISDLFANRGVPFDAAGAQNALVNNKSMDSLSLSRIRLFRNAPVAQIAKDNSGFVATENARRFVRENSDIDPLKVTPEKLVNVEAPQRVATLPVREGLTEAAVRTALQSAGEELLRIETAQVAELIDDVPLEPGECAGAEDNPDWPISIEQLRRSLDTNARLRQANRTSPTILLIDTGFDPVMKGQAVPEQSLGRMRDFTGTGLAIHYGVNTASRVNDPIPPDVLKSRFHGGEVAGTLLGSHFEAADRALLPYKITFASIAQRQGNRAYLDISAISSAYGVALQSDIKIINASIAAEAHREIFINALRGAGGRTLLIAAAGNVSTPPQPFPTTAMTWPATLGGAHQIDGAPVVTVGAHNPSGRPLSFSRLGADKVDLLAPGCLIPTYTFDTAAGTVKPVRLNGTSFAAPVVAMIAGLLAAEGLHPSAIRDRLLTSADMDEELITSAWSGGRLNPVKALSVWRDFVHYKEKVNGLTVERRATGQVQGGHLEVRICDDLVKWQHVRKLAVTTRSSDQSQWARGWRTSDGSTRRMAKIGRCPASELQGTLTIKDEAERMITIPAADIIDFVARES